MWNQADNSIENIGNYESALEMAKEQLNKINEDIRLSLEHKSNLISDNDQLLKARLIEIEKIRQEADLRMAEANKIHSDNSRNSEYLESERKKLEHDVSNYKISIESLNRLIESTGLKNESREQELLETVNKINKEKDDISKREYALNECIASLNKEKDSLRLETDSVYSQRKESQENLEESNRFSKEAQDKLQLSIKLKEEADAFLMESKKSLSEAESIKTVNLEVLSEIFKKEQAIKDLIIDSKKSKIEADKSIEQSQKIIAEATQKIFDLNILKETLSKQEK